MKCVLWPRDTQRFEGKSELFSTNWKAAATGGHLFHYHKLIEFPLLPHFSFLSDICLLAYKQRVPTPSSSVFGSQETWHPINRWSLITSPAYLLIQLETGTDWPDTALLQLLDRKHYKIKTWFKVTMVNKWPKSDSASVKTTWAVCWWASTKRMGTGIVLGRVRWGRPYTEENNSWWTSKQVSTLIYQTEMSKCLTTLLPIRFLIYYSFKLNELCSYKLVHLAEIY